MRAKTSRGSRARTRRRRLRILVTAGPTREKIDPIRFISNYSTGRMGYEIARWAKARGHLATLISGPVSIARPKGVKVISVESALEMRDAVLKALKGSDVLIMAAAVSDWRPKEVKAARIKRRGQGRLAKAGENYIKLAENPDIILESAGSKGKRLFVGFALETENLTKNAMKKLKAKNLDLIVANRFSDNATVFGDCEADFLVIDRYGRISTFKNCSKSALARRIIDKVEALCYINF